MEKHDIVATLMALAQESRLDIFRYLVQAGNQGAAAGQISRQLGLAPTTLSFHLKAMLHAEIVKCQRQSRCLIYTVNCTKVRRLLTFLAANCDQDKPINASQGGLVVPNTHIDQHMHTHNDHLPNNHSEGEMMSAPIFNVLFICTGNSARSIMAESLINYWGQGRFRGYSAGSHPTGVVHPLALELLKRQNMDVTESRSKSWDEFATDDAPKMDFVFTVCSRAAGETCPIWVGHPTTAHWGVEDPAALKGSDIEQIQAFRDAFLILERRIKIFVSLPLHSLDQLRLQQELNRIGQLQS